MKRCRAFKPIAGTRTAWVRCARRAEKGSRFCRGHEDAIVGAMLGVVVEARAVEKTKPRPGGLGLEKDKQEDAGLPDKKRRARTRRGTARRYKERKAPQDDEL